MSSTVTERAGDMTLKPCPFRHEVKRGPFVEFDRDDFGFVRVSCGDCGCAGPFVTVTGEKLSMKHRAEAIALWNTRTEDTPNPPCSLGEADA